MKRAFVLMIAAVAVVACGPTRPPAAPIVPRTPAHTATPSPTATVSAQPTTPHRMLRLGSHGLDVRRVQEDLAASGYWLGKPDGVFGDTTQQAVYALQKAAGLDTDGVVGPRTRRALARQPLPTARSSSGHVVEIDLRRDLLLLVDDGLVRTVLNTSTGGGYTYVSDGTVGVARTPTGRFHVYRQIDGLQVSHLGVLWRPKYFVSGYAIHGSPSVPPYPASHGCVRLTNAAIDWIWSQNLMQIGTPVWVY
jgi:lipoprotein-anchoring transpeptidase ErfK/SrfK